MCGIAGMYRFKRGSLHEPYFSKCLEGMHHRGPDDNDTWHNNENYIAGFVRLSIRDLSINGRQPMFSSDRQYCISFNGEIYNTAALKSQLQPFGITYHSSTDTEVLLYSIIHLGIEKTLAVADGIFAFAFYDIQRNMLLLARDRMGVKPLYIGDCSEGVVYSSQYDHIINHPFFQAQGLDEKVIANYLYLGYMPEGSGVVKQTTLLPHGYYMKVENGATSLNLYYTYSPENAYPGKLPDFDAILARSVDDQLVSDVAVGTFMSGGVDSTLVSYYANSHKHFKSFTLGVNDSRMDETAVAAAYAEKFHIDHYCRNITADDLKRLIIENTKAFSEPFADYSSLPTLMLSRFAREHVTVALSGDGGDELFWGYKRNVKALKAVSLYQYGRSGRRLRLLSSKFKSSDSIELKRHWNSKSFADYYYTTLAITGAPQWLPQIMDIDREHPFFLKELLDAGEAGSIDEEMQLMRKMETDIHLQRILLKVDRASMFHSLEVRVPFLSNMMLEYSLQNRYTDCIEGDQGKINLKRSLIKKAGTELVMLPKKGFTIPIDEWMRKDIADDVKEKILEMPQHLAVFFKKQQLEQLLQMHFNGEQNTGWFIWALYSLVNWDTEHHHKPGLSCV